MLDQGEVINTRLHHLQHIFHGQRGINPLDVHWRQFAQRQLLIDQVQRLPRRAARRERDRATRQLLQTRITTFALDPDQHQRHAFDNRITGGNCVRWLDVQQFAGRHQIAFPAQQCAEQLIFGLGNDFKGDFLTVAGMPVEVALKSPQPVIFNTNRLALHLPRTVATLIDQHPQHLTAADLRQIAHLTWLPGL